MGHRLINGGTQSASLCAHMHEHLISGSPALPLALLSILQIVSHVSKSRKKKEARPDYPSAQTPSNVAFIDAFLLLLEENGVFYKSNKSRSTRSGSKFNNTNKKFSLF